MASCINGEYKIEVGQIWSTDKGLEVTIVGVEDNGNVQYSFNSNANASSITQTSFRRYFKFKADAKYTPVLGTAVNPHNNDVVYKSAPLPNGIGVHDVPYFDDMVTVEKVTATDSSNKEHIESDNQDMKLPELQYDEVLGWVVK